MSFLWRLLFGSREATPSPSDAHPFDVVADYGKLLEAPTFAPIADVSMLPHPKEKIKRSILAALATVTDLKMQEHLKSAYLRLATFQAGVGPTSPELKLPKDGPSAITQELIKEMIPTLEHHAKWSAVVEAEQRTLISELHALGYWKD